MVREQEALDHIALGVLSFWLGVHNQQALLNEHLVRVQQALTTLHDHFLNSQIASDILRLAHLVPH